jgi:3-methylcrotonyl-CoA carboxylase alpha subunit
VRYLVNGAECELPPPGEAPVVAGDRLMVRHDGGTATALAVRDGEDVLVSFLGHSYRVSRVGRAHAADAAADQDEVRAPMPGLVVEVLAGAGSEVRRGDRLVVMEAMKTLQSLAAPRDGKVAEIGAQAGDQVAEGDLLVRLDPIPEEK